MCGGGGVVESRAFATSGDRSRPSGDNVIASMDDRSGWATGMAVCEGGRGVILRRAQFSHTASVGGFGRVFVLGDRFDTCPHPNAEIRAVVRQVVGAGKGPAGRSA